MTHAPSSADILRELEPTAAACLERHVKVAKEWFPHEYIPWSLGRTFDELPWCPSQAELSPVAQGAMEVTLLMEDNLPSYFRELTWATGVDDDAWGVWARRWAAEEARHASAIRDFLLVTRGVDPIELERARMRTLESGWRAISCAQKGVLRLLAYASLQELAMRVHHRNVGKLVNEAGAEKLFQRIANDENLHMIFYRDVLTAGFELAPSAATSAVADEVLGFAMPGIGLVDFVEKARAIARAGVYDLRVHHREVLLPMLAHWRFFERDGLDAEAESARQRVADFLAAIGSRVSQSAEKLRAPNRVAG